ncbi:peptidase M20, partial [Streptococcus dysgalactiae]
FDRTVESANLEIHSKFGGVIDSATWYLLEAIASLRDRNGRLLVPDIYEHEQEPTKRELDLIDIYAIEQLDDLKKLYGLELPMLQSERRDFLKSYYNQPSIGIQGIQSGYQGQGVKTIIPSQASAKM